MFFRRLFQLYILFLLLLFGHSTAATNYYFHTSKGNPQNTGNSTKSPYQQLNKIKQLNLNAGDSILLAAGQTFIGSIILQNLSGFEEAPIVISSYPTNDATNEQKATIDAHGFANGIYLENCSNIHISDLVIIADGGTSPKIDNPKKAMRCGVLVKTSSKGVIKNVKLDHLWVKDIYYEEQGYQRGKKDVRSANGTQSYGWGIRFINQTSDASMEGIVVQNCRVENVAHTGIKFTGGQQGIKDLQVLNNKVFKSGGPGIQMSRVENGIVRSNTVNFSGSNDDSRKWGRGSGLWTWGSKNILIEHNKFMNANGPGDSAGCHIDFNCNDVVVQYNFSVNNAGGFCEILGNNYNCAYRYNVSVNDGHRDKKKNGAFQEGKIFWLSGFCGKGNKRNGPFNSYFYNNTIYVSKDIVAKIAVDKAASGVFIANNIFYIQGESKAVLGDQYVPEKEGESQVKNIVFENNLYLSESNWPENILIQDQRMIVGNPEFSKNGGLELLNYIPGNAKLIANKGIPITEIPGDDIGLRIGLNVEKDILGNPISGLPDLGAIELIN